MPKLQCEDFSYPSADGRHKAAGCLYTVPGVPVRGVVQLSHGMCEYVQRYTHMAQFLAEHGFALAGNDHLGHGNTAAKTEYGHMADRDGRKFVLADLREMNARLHRHFPGVPLFLLGHSMGSFFARWYAECYPDTIDGLVLSGTAGPSAVNQLGYLLACVVAATHKPGYVSPLLVKMSFGSYCKRIENPQSPNAWLTRDEAAVKAYDADEKCGFAFSAASYREFLWVLCHVNRKKWSRSIRKELPILLYAGAEDPVGRYGAGVREVWARLGDAGVQDLSCQIYEDGRHEMHNELNKQEVFEDLLAWLEEHLPQEKRKIV